MRGRFSFKKNRADRDFALFSQPMKSFLKTFFASYFGTCFGIVSLAFLPILLLSAVVFVSVSKVTSGNASLLQDKTFLVIDISRGFSDHPTFSAYNRNDTVFSQGYGAYGLLDTLLAVEEAQKDSKICGIFLTGTACRAGIPSLEELRGALIRFRESGKPVLAYLPSPTLGDYFLASAASKIWIHPFAELPINGIASEGVYFKKALEKFGVGIQIVKVGKFKAAVEPLIAETMSEEDRRQRETILRTQWELIVADLAVSRQLDPEHVDTIAKQKGFLDAREALEQKLVDAEAYKDEAICLLCASGDFDYELNSFRQIDLADYLKLKGIAVIPKFNEFPEDVGSRIAVVYAEGEIVDGYGDIDNVGGERLAEMIRELRGNPDVLAIVLRVNSPGGSVFASEQIRRELELAARKIPLVVSMGDVAASGGYWIATPAQKIFAEATTVTGSIGVFGVLPNFKNLGEKIGVSAASVATSEFAELGTISRPQTPKELAVFQKSVDKIYDRFTSLVAESRKLSQARVKEIAEGRIWDGKTAKQLSLVDEIGGLSSAIDYAKTLVDEPNLQLRQYPGAVNPYRQIADALTAPESAPVVFAARMLGEKRSPAGTLSREFADLWKKMRALNDPNCVYARLPWDFPTQTR